jgi:2-hydroxychromene-2-carboxylate isomerase
MMREVADEEVATTTMPQVTFYFDLGSPYAYLAAERMATLVPEPVAWQPILLGGLFKRNGRSSWALGDYRRRQTGMAEIELRAQGYGLPAMRWPDPWPSDYLYAMRVATFAFAVGRGRELCTCAFRDAFQRGRDLSIAAHVLDAAEQAGLDRGEAQTATQDPQIKRALRDATDAANDLGVFGVPTVAIGDELFWGEDRLEDAVAHLSTSADRGGSGQIDR